ncbi:MAG: thiamine phosphate synthase [Cyanobacteria bacterium P01_A01_bin.123]
MAELYSSSSNSASELISDYRQVSPTTLYRILDANFDRAREGLRIIEEWCRFGLNHAQFTNQIKQWRQTLAHWHWAEIRAARDTPSDPGVELTHPQEAIRTNLQQVLQANFCRVQEALRVLEEYGKLINPDMGATFKRMRYQVYTLESQLGLYQRQDKLQQAQTYLVTSPHEHLIDVVEAALKGGLGIVQYREKVAHDCDRWPIVQQLRSLCDQYGALFLVNDRIDLALAANADGVHLGQQDLPITVARQLLGDQAIIGRSTTSPDEMQRAIAEGADYIGVGPVYATPTKPDKAAAGLDYVRHVAAHATLPWFAIGGIDSHNLREVIDAGAQRVAIVRAIMQADNPTLITQSLATQLPPLRAKP